MYLNSLVSPPTQTYNNRYTAAATTPMADMKQHIAAANTCSWQVHVQQVADDECVADEYVADEYVAEEHVANGIVV